MRLSKAARKMNLAIVVTSLIFIAGGAVFYRSLEAFAFAGSVAAMAALNVVKVCMIERTVKKTMDIEEPAHGKNYARLQYFARLALTGAVLAAAAIIAQRTGLYGGVWGAVAGVLTFHIAVFSLKFVNLDDEEEGGEPDG
jgi:hypothetical protein